MAMDSLNMRCGLKVRFEVMNIINNSHSISVKLPSAQELADKFGMSRRSVTMELKTLIDEGLIYGVKGAGTFTNPRCSVLNEHLPSRKIIGVLTGDSRQYCYDYNRWAFLSAPGFAIMPDLGFPHPVRLSSLKAEAVYKELKSLGLNGIIWSWPPNNMGVALKKLMAAGMPVVTLVDAIKEIPAVAVDYEQCGYDIAACLQQEKRSSILWCAFDSFVYKRMNGALKLLAKSGYCQDPELVITDMAAFGPRLTELIEQDRLPEAIYLHGTAFYEMRDVFASCGLDPYDGRCRLIAGWSIVKDVPEFKGIVRKYPYEKIANLAVGILQGQFAGEAPIESKTVKMEITSIE
jgi:hypothetical protein